MNNDTIAAIATAPGPAGIAVVRLSGPQALQIGLTIAHLTTLAPYTFRHTNFYNPNGQIIDDGVILYFKAPHSYTGEDIVELQCHGGQIPPSLILKSTLAHGARIAEPGEYTKRAYLNGKIDLTHAEAVMDLICAKSERAAHAATEQLQGELSRKINAITDTLNNLRANIEHLLDFDEGEIPSTFQDEIIQKLQSLQTEITTLLSSANQGMLLREGAKIVISGNPNAGKSSLLNALLGRNRAIVSSIPGTTRDTIEESIILNGIPIRLIDTAGLRTNPTSEIEEEGIKRSQALLQTADLHLRVIDVTTPFSEPNLPPSKTILIFNKSDLPHTLPHTNYHHILLSATTGQGLDTLRQAIISTLHISHDTTSEISLRHAQALQTANKHLISAITALKLSPDNLVPAAEELTYSFNSLGTITGRTSSEELLSTIFSSFCIGK